MNRVEMLMDMLAEEAGEVVQAAIKCNRFTPGEVYPKTGKSNSERLHFELNDVLAITTLLQLEGVLPKNLIDWDMQKAKKAKAEKMLKYSKSLGTLQS